MAPGSIVQAEVTTTVGAHRGSCGWGTLRIQGRAPDDKAGISLVPDPAVRKRALQLEKGDPGSLEKAPEAGSDGATRLDPPRTRGRERNRRWPGGVGQSVA